MALKPNLISRLACLPDDFAFHGSVPVAIRPHVRQQRDRWEREPADFISVGEPDHHQIVKQFKQERRAPVDLDQHVRHFVVPGPVQDHFLNVAARLPDRDSRIALAQLALHGVSADALKRKRLALFMEMFSRRCKSYNLASQVRYLRDNFNNGHGVSSYMLEHSIFDLCADHPDIVSAGLRVPLPDQGVEIDSMAIFAKGLKVYFEAKWKNIKRHQERKLLNQASHDGALLIYVRGFFGESLTNPGAMATEAISLAGLATLMEYPENIIERNLSGINRARLYKA